MPFNRPIPGHKPQSKASGGVKTLVEAEKMMQIAFLLPSAAIVGWLPGAWLDGKLHQSWIGLAGMLFGGFSGLVYVVRLVMVGGKKEIPGSEDGSGTKGDDPTVEP